MSDGGKIIISILIVCIFLALGGWLSCLIGTSIWNEIIANRFGWTEPITKWDFFKLEIMTDSLLWCALLYKGSNSSSRKKD
jgi:hypothetical protein